MALRTKYLHGFIILLLLLINPITPAFLLKAQEEENSSEALSVILVIDVSGSMERTDPEMLRETAANVFIDLLSPEDLLGIITFDHESEVIIPLQRVDSPANKEHIKETLSPELAPRGYTDFKLALETAYAQFQEANLQGTRPSVVLLTDGEPDPGPEYDEDPALMEQYMAGLWGVAEDFVFEGIPVYTVGFSDEIDPDFIENLSVTTRGSYYVHDEPTDLVLAFFELLGNLKSRQPLHRETLALQDESKIFPIPVDELTRQVNLVAVNLDGEGVQLELEPPQGVDEDVGDISIDVQPGYSLAVLHQPEEACWGEWTASVSGTGEIQFMADMDLHIQAFLETPVPGSQHPLNEPIHFRVSLTRGTAMRDMPFEAEVRLKKPDADPVTVPLREENGYFAGKYEDVDRTGDYELQVRILMDEEVVSSFSNVLYVRNLPSLSTDFWGGEGLQQGERQLVTASLFMGGRRLPEGRELELERFGFVFESREGGRLEVPLFDSGSEEHGDLRAGDGIFSNYLVFEEEGVYEGALVASGEYRGTDFMLEKSVEPFEVQPPGNILLTLPESSIIGVPGREAALPLEVENDSYFPETLLVEQPGGMISLTDTSFELEPGETKTLELGLRLAENLEYGEHEVPLSFEAENDLTGVEPEELAFTLEAMTSWQTFYRNFFGIIVASSIALAALALGAIGFFGGGFFFYRTMVHPRTRVGGNLEVTNIEGENPGHDEPQTLKLGKLKKNPVVISMGSENPNADFRIENSEFSYDIIIQARWDVRLPRFIQGWKALLEKHVPIRVFIRCTPPGILEHEGQIFTEKELFHSEEFETGGYLLRYNNPYGKWFKEKGDGVDLLQGWGEGADEEKGDLK